MHINKKKNRYDGELMAGMKRFVTYIYSYEDKKKGSNIGFAKIEIRGEECRIEVHLRGAYVKEARCEVFMFREADKAMEGVRIGEMRLLNGNGDFVVSVRAGHIGESILGIHNMEGILLLGDGEQIYMSRWREGNPLIVSKENFRIWKPKEAVPQDVIVEKTAKGTAGEENASAAENKAEADNRMSDEHMQATEIPMHNIFPTYDWEAVWDGLKQNHTVCHPFVDRETECMQIELKHLRELPKRYWYLGNNSFLLHGFFNYQYLVVGRTGDDRWFIGIPGVYQRQERVMAAIFGFPEFMAMASDAISEGNSTEPLNQFGCWLRYMEA